jgi:hypothetical protein
LGGFGGFFEDFVHADAVFLFLPGEPGALGVDGKNTACFELPRQDSNLDKESQKNFSADSKPQINKDLGATALSLTAELTADADLAYILEVWPTLSAPIRRAILVLVESAG